MRNIQTLKKTSNTEIFTVPETASKINADSNDYKGKLLKLIPAEVVAAYVFIDGIIQSSSISVHTLNIVQWAAFGFLFFINPIYLYKVSNVNHKLQLFFSTIGFAVWVFALGGPFLTLGSKDLVHLLGSIVLAMYTLLIPIFVTPETK